MRDTVDLMYEAGFFEVALGNEVRSWRQTRDLTIVGLAERAKVSKSTIERLENATHATGVHIAFAVAHALNVPLSTIVRRAEEVAELRKAEAAKVVELRPAPVRTPAKQSPRLASRKGAKTRNRIAEDQDAAGEENQDQ